MIHDRNISLRLAPGLIIKTPFLLATIAAFFFMTAICPSAELAADPTPTTVKLKPDGLGFAVETLLNGSVKTDLKLDTGSSFTVISHKIARRLGYAEKLSLAPRFPIFTSGGETWVRLVAFDSVRVGGAVAQTVVGAVSSHLGEGVDGLLGLSFLDNFNYRIDGVKGQFTIYPVTSAETSFGGQDRNWWRSRFASYAGEIEKFRIYLHNHEHRTTAKKHGPDGRVEGFTRHDLVMIINFYERLIDQLNARARELGVPDSWKTYP